MHIYDILSSTLMNSLITTSCGLLTVPVRPFHELVLVIPKNASQQPNQRLSSVSVALDLVTSLLIDLMIHQLSSGSVPDPDQ